MCKQTKKPRYCDGIHATINTIKEETKLVFGPNAKKPLVLDFPLFVSDMSLGALSKEAKMSIVKGSEMARTEICSGEGGW